MNELLTIIKAVACAGIFWRIFTFHWPKHATYRVGITTIAYAIMFMVGGQAISLMIGRPQVAPYFDAGIYLAFLALVLIARGNLANILKMEFDWSGVERRRESGNRP